MGPMWDQRSRSRGFKAVLFAFPVSRSETLLNLKPTTVVENVKLSLVGHMESVVDETFDVHVTTVRKGLVHLVTTARKGLMHLDTTCHVNVGCACNVASGGGETGSPPPQAPRLSLPKR